MTPNFRRLSIIAGFLTIVLLALVYRRWNESPITDASYLVQVKPTYPEAAIQARIQGQVIVSVTIGSDGRLLASWIRSTSGSTLLDDAALAAARQSTYRAPTLGNIAIQRSYIVYYTFSSQG